MNKIPKYVINLERDKHKLKRFNKPMEKQNINYNIWRGAIIKNKEDLIKCYTKHFYTKGTKNIKLPGNVGSAFAHLSLWDYCIKQNSDYFMIFEDNSIVKDDFIKKVDNYVKKIGDFDFFNLNVIRPMGETKDNILFKYKPLNPFPYPPPNTWMSSYIISKNLMKFLLNISKSINYDKLPIDKVVMNIMNSISTLKYYSINTNVLTTHIELYSDTRKLLNRKDKLNIDSYISVKPV